VNDRLDAPPTIDEIQVCRMAREFRGEVLASGATLLSDIAARLSKFLHDDDLVVQGAQSYGSWDCKAMPLVEAEEHIARRSAVGQMSWEHTFDIVSADKLRIFVGPPQIDRHGNANLSVIGDWSKPTIQLIGSRGLPDDLWRLSVIHFHVPSHTTRTVVDRVDFVSSFGYGETRRRVGGAPAKPGVLVTDLGVFRWDESTEEIYVESIHPGVTIEQLRAATGFPLTVDDDVAHTELPTAEQLKALRTVIDPWGVSRGLTPEDKPWIESSLSGAFEHARRRDGAG